MTNFLAFLNSGIVLAINIIKWISVIFLTFHIAVLGFDVMNNGKDSTDVLTKVKSKIVPLAIGFFLVVACSALQGTIKDFLKQVNETKTTTGITTDKITGSGVKDELFTWG